LPEQVTIRVFLIKQFNMELQVVHRSTGLVKIEPYKCKEENLRHWTVIAKSQTFSAQAQLQMNKGRQMPEVLVSYFENDGWDVKEVEVREEFSL
jgi:hypothetical protein